MVIHPRNGWKARARMCVRAFFHASLTLSVLVLVSCATSDRSRVKESRDAFVMDDYSRAEAALYSSEVFKSAQNRLEHFMMLSSIAMSEGQFEKAAFYLQKSRDVSNSARSDHAGFEWFSSIYGGNPIEYSYLHYFLVLSYQLSAEAGGTPSWSTPEIQDQDGNVLVQAQSFPARRYSPKEISELRAKARSELLAWDSHFENLKRSFPGLPYYQEDVWARLLASYVHSSFSSNSDRRTAEILSEQALSVLTHDLARMPSLRNNQESIVSLSKKLKDRAQGKVKGPSTLFLCEAGVVPSYQKQTFHLGVSTLFRHIEDPYLRAQLEQIGFRVVLEFAPEFGLIAFSGAVAGAMSGDDDEDDAPKYFTDAVDRSFGFEVSFPKLRFPSSDTQVTLNLTSESQQYQFPLPIVSPIQEIIASELKAREDKEMYQRALKIGIQYLTILIPAVKAYQGASKEGNLLKKIGILAGYYVAKKAIDKVNEPDLRSWSTLPQIVAADLITGVQGSFDAKLTFQNQNGVEEKNLGKLSFGQTSPGLIWRHISQVSILNARPSKPVGTRVR